MRVLIAANAVRMGGALQHLSGLLSAFAGTAPDDRWLVVTNAAAAAALRLPERFAIQVEATERLDPLRRFWMEQRLLARRAQAFGADVLLSFNSFALRASPCPQVLVAANALYVCPEYWRQIEPPERPAAWLRSVLLGWSLRQAEAVLVPSQWMAEALSRRYHLPSERLRVVHHGVGPAFFSLVAERSARPAGSTVRLLAASKHGVNKDFLTLTRAVALLLKQGPRELHVQLTGSPSESRYAQATHRLLSELGLHGRMSFSGELSSGQLLDLYRQADLFVFPSWCESFGLPQLEAAASGLPVIAPDLPVSRELLADTARYYRPLDPTSLADALAELLDDREAAHDLARRAATRAQPFTWPRAAQSTIGILHSAASRRPMAAP